jgi:hypothetical protein
MRRHYLAIATVIVLGVAGVASAQTNPQGRGGTDRDPFSGGAMSAPAPSGSLGQNSFGQHGMGRVTPRSVVPVTPVPEPGQWAMMLVGLGLVGWIVRRNTRR